MGFLDPEGMCPVEVDGEPCRISEFGLYEMRQYERMRPEAYDDACGKATCEGRHGNMTIGYGHKIVRGENFPARITQGQAESLFQRDVAEKVNPSLDRVNVYLNQNQVDALGDFIYNAGSGAFASDVLPLINKGDFAGATEMMNRYTKMTINHEKVTAPGLVRRRADEVRLFNNPMPLGCEISDWINKGVCRKW